MGQGDPGRQHQAAGMKSRPKIGKTFHNVSLGENRRRSAARRGDRIESYKPAHAILLRFICLLMAQSGHPGGSALCPLSGVKRTLAGCPSLSRQLTNESPYRPALGDCLGGVESVAVISVPLKAQIRQGAVADQGSSADGFHPSGNRGPKATPIRLPRTTADSFHPLPL